MTITKLHTRGIKMHQTQLAYHGLTIGLVGMLIAGVLSSSVKTQYGFSEKAELIETLLFLVGFCIVIIGLQFLLASYKTEEETPRWIKKLSTFWK
jgi:hypothetical protein